MKNRNVNFIQKLKSLIYNLIIEKSLLKEILLPIHKNQKEIEIVPL